MPLVSPDGASCICNFSLPASLPDCSASTLTAKARMIRPFVQLSERIIRIVKQAWAFTPVRTNLQFSAS